MLYARRFLCALILAAGLGLGAHGSRQHGEPLLWVDPGDPSTFDFEYGTGGPEQQPRPPFAFINEDNSGTTPKINVRDARGATWNIKWGDEGHSSVFCSRLVAACGYFAPTEYFIASGRIEDVHDLTRARRHVESDGRFSGGRFQLRKDSPQYLRDRTWSWIENPFVGTKQLHGLQVLLLLLSNWDAKDSRDVITDPQGKLRVDTNLAILHDPGAGTERYLYMNDDWGAALGAWGGFFGRSKWNCREYAEQSAEFVTRNPDGSLEWGYRGKHRKDLTSAIRASDIQWLLQYLGRITDDQIRRGLQASGATTEETDCYAAALRQRIDQLRRIAP